MKDWIILTIAVSVLSSVFSFLLSEGEMKRAFRVLSGAVIAFVMLFPLMDLNEVLTSFDTESLKENFSSSFNDENDEVLYAAVKTGYENLLIEHIAEEFLCVKDINVYISSENDGYCLDSVEIVLCEKTDSYRQIEDKIYKITGSDCEVIFINGY